MWFRKASARRQAIREDVAEAESLPVQVRRNRSHIVVIATVFFVVAAAVQFWPAVLSPYREGDRATADIRSPVAFRMDDPEQTARLRDGTRATSPPVVVPTALGTDHILSQLLALKEDVQNARNLSEVPADDRQRFPGLTEAELHDIKNPDAAGYATMVRTFIAADLVDIPFVSRRDFDVLRTYKSGGRVGVMTAKGPVAENVTDRPLSRFMIVGEVTPQQRAFIRQRAANHMSQAMAEVVASYLAGKYVEPTFAYDAALSADLADARAKMVMTGGKPIRENEIIVAAGQMVDAEILATLKQAQRELQLQTLARDPWAGWFSAAGKILTVLLLTAVGVAYVVRVNAVGGAKTFGQGWAVCGLLLGSLIVARAVVGCWPQSAYLSGMAPTLLAAIILVVAYNQRFALGIAVLHGLLVTLTLGMGLDFYLPMMTGAAILCFGLREIRTRGKLIEMGFLAGVGIFVAIWALGFAHMIGSVWNPWIVAAGWKVLFVESLWGAAGGITVAMLMSAILPPVERIFKITTAMTLLELCDANRPLLRRLQQEAPGTFNHSLTVGIMAEAAGNAVGANGLLCRVGAYYHDVGKLSKPQYFIENQTGGAPNRHEKLSPAMSLLIIVGHVKDGIELAREYALPWVVHQFIAQHHGTTLVEYFFHAAKKRKEQEGDHIAEISETEFRYPGPKPQTREAAILMICDVCESVVRSIEEPTAGRIAAAVHTMITKRLMDGQFNECDLTLKQLSVIEEKLIRTLAGIHHGRVAYPVSASVGDAPQPLSQPA